MATRTFAWKQTDENWGYVDRAGSTYTRHTASGGDGPLAAFAGGKSATDRGFFELNFAALALGPSDDVTGLSLVFPVGSSDGALVRFGASAFDTTADDSDFFQGFDPVVQASYSDKYSFRPGVQTVGFNTTAVSDFRTALASAGNVFTFAFTLYDERTIGGVSLDPTGNAVLTVTFTPAGDGGFLMRRRHRRQREAYL